MFDTKQVTQSLNDFSKVLDNISSKVKSIGDIKPNSSGIKKDTEGFGCYNHHSSR